VGYLFTIKGIRKGCLFCLNGIKKGSRFDIEAEPPGVELCTVKPPPLPGGGSDVQNY